MTNTSANKTGARFVDSHTGGEPTRIIVSGGPDLGSGPLDERIGVFKDRFDEFRRSVVLEPRGSEELVGGLLVEPHQPDCSAGILFFNNVGMLGMCGHGTIGLAITLAHLGRIETGRHLIDTPVGVVAFELEEGGWASVENVPSYRLAKDVAVEVDLAFDVGFQELVDRNLLIGVLPLEFGILVGNEIR